jgi:hypothetical protein
VSEHSPDPPPDGRGELGTILSRQPVVAALLERVPSLDLPGWYLGAGSVAQAVWNALHGFELTFGITDYDLAYLDPDDLTAETEHDVERRATLLIEEFAEKVDVTNEARVHLWYEQGLEGPEETPPRRGIRRDCTCPRAPLLTDVYRPERAASRRGSPARGRLGPRRAPGRGAWSRGSSARTSRRPTIFGEGDRPKGQSQRCRGSLGS